MSEEIIEDEIIIEDEVINEQEIIEEEVIEEVPQEEIIEQPSEEELLEIARLEEIARQDDLNARYAALHDHRMAGAQLNIGNVDLHFQHHILFNKSNDVGENSMKELEAMDLKGYQDVQNSLWLEKRKEEYAKIDLLLMEAIAEKEAGNPEKMQAYLALRGEIKGKYPKPE